MEFRIQYNLDSYSVTVIEVIASDGTYHAAGRAQAVKNVANAEAMELTFVGLPNAGMTDPEAIDPQVKVILFTGRNDVATLNVPAIGSTWFLR